eukprot:CAMPEP_0117609322 /NCGR_PEP_ID=MMETSP0784-20121206/81273_1 /TAXON_ID=39447 /ORGANISM="" /LENGTH=44 /DNA_ID= /DNA_START= /DNA_END= /DNA_ORIENTATION=
MSERFHEFEEFEVQLVVLLQEGLLRPLKMLPCDGIHGGPPDIEA